MSPFLSSDFVSCTCTLEVTLHSAAFNVFRLCFKYDALSKTAPYVCFPHIQISNICSLLVITYTFGQQRQSTDWEGERLERGELPGCFFFSFSLSMYGWLITWCCRREALVLKNTGRSATKRVFPLLFQNNWNLIQREFGTLLLPGKQIIYRET